MGTSAVPADSEEYEYEEVEVEVEDDDDEVTEEEEAAEKLLRDKLISGSSGAEEPKGDSKVQFDLEKNKEHVYSANPQQLYKTKSYTTSSAPSRPALKSTSCSASLTTPSTATTTSSSSSTANATTLWAPTNLAVALENSKSKEAEEAGDSMEILPPSAEASDSLPPSLPATNSSSEAKTNGEIKTVRTVPFSFLIHYKTSFGESLYLTGNVKELGNWDKERAIEMYWNLGHYWRADVEVPAGSYLKFKFFVKDTTVYPPTITYEPSPNHHHAVPTEKEIESGGNPHPLILCTWAHPLPRALRNAPEAHEPEIPPEVKERLDREMREFRALRFNLKLENMKREKELTSSIDRVFAYRKSSMWSSDFSSCGFDRDDPILVMDVGTENLRLGFAGDADPKVVAPSIVGSKKSGLTETFMVIDPSTSHGSHVNRKLYSYRQPIHKGIVENWEDMELMWKYYIFEEKALLREHSKVPVFLSESVFNPKYNREKTLSVLFESLALPSVSICNQEVLGLHASTPTGKSVTGLVINSGADTTQIVPVYEGCALRHLAVQSDMGGKLLTKRLCEYFHIGDKDWLAEYEKNERMKRALKFLPRDEVDACRRLTIRGSSAYASVNAPSDGFMDKERYLIPEVLFTPEESGWHGKGIQEGVLKVLSSCDPELRQQLANNIVLVGGNSMIEGFPERLFEELNRVLPSEIPDFSVFARPDRANQVWLGGSLMTSQPLTPQLFISKSLYEECGASIVHRMCHF